MPKAVRTTVAVGAATALLAVLPGCASAGSGIVTTAKHSTTAARPVAPIVTWYHQTEARISAVEQSITTAQWMTRRPKHRGLSAACTKIRTNVIAAQAAPTAPDARVRTELAAELGDFARAADECLQGHLDAAGRSVDAGHAHAEVGGTRVLALLHAAG